MDKYKERDELILSLRDQGKTLQHVGTMFNLTRERVRQIVEKRSNTRAETLSPHA